MGTFLSQSYYCFALQQELSVDVRLVPFSVVCVSLPRTRGALVRRWTNLSLLCVFPSHLREGFWLDVGLVSLCRVFFPPTYRRLSISWRLAVDFLHVMYIKDNKRWYLIAYLTYCRHVEFPQYVL